MADEYISKRDAVEETLKYIISSGVSNQSTWNECVSTIADTLQDMRPADVAPVVYGRWIKYTGMGKVQWMCSECSAEEKNPKVANYCYHCGAKMDGEE